MSLQHLSFGQVDEKALASLATEGVCETKTLEFKQDLQVATDEQKQEFLSDVTALANTDGGDIVFGMRAEKGVAKELVGLRNFAPDDRIGQLENLLRDFVQPRLSGIQLRSLPLGNGNHALTVRVARSFAAPHMVRHQGITRFCGRNSNGKYDLDVQELRSAFLASETMSDRLKNFRLNRINKLVSGETPVVLTCKNLVVLHLLPLVSARPDIRLETSDFHKLIETAQPRPMRSNSWGSSFNFDGLIVTSRWAIGNFHGYVQIFRSGFFEIVDSELLNPMSDGQKVIPSVGWEQSIIETFPSYLKAMEVLQLSPPYVASMSLLNIRGFVMAVGSGMVGGQAIDREHLLTDEVLIGSTSESPASMLRPLFDQVWNACGYHGSLNYDQNGQWRAQR